MGTSGIGFGYAGTRTMKPIPGFRRAAPMQPTPRQYSRREFGAYVPAILARPSFLSVQSRATTFLEFLATAARTQLVAPDLLHAFRR